MPDSTFLITLAVFVSVLLLFAALSLLFLLMAKKGRKSGPVKKQKKQPAPTKSPMKSKINYYEAGKEMVRHDPVAAAKTLKKWISEKQRMKK